MSVQEKTLLILSVLSVGLLFFATLFIAVVRLGNRVLLREIRKLGKRVEALEKEKP